MARLARRRFVRKWGPSVPERSLESLKRSLREPSPSLLKRTRSEERPSEHRDCEVNYKVWGYKIWEGIDIDLYKWASDDDRSTFSDTSDHASDIAPRSSTCASGLTELQDKQDYQDQSCASRCSSESLSETFQDPGLNLCHRCVSINMESLSSGFGHEHKLLSELPSRDELDYLDDWGNKASTGICKLCLVFVKASSEDGRSFLDPDRHRLLISLVGKQIHDHDHFDDYVSLGDRKVKARRRTTSELSLKIADLHILERLESAESQFSYAGLQPLYPYTARLLCFTAINDPCVSFGVSPVRPIGKSTSSTASFEVAAEWLSQCLAAEAPQAAEIVPEHLRRGRLRLEVDDFQIELDGSSSVDSAGPKRPTRVLEIGSGPESGLVRLTEDNKDEVVYATLSYCWGSRPQYKQCEWLTTTKNVHSRRAGMRRSELPQTLQDSITVAERLGIKHIWIDSLCIIQDSEVDWAVEAAKMGQIYQGSIVTVVAASSTSAEHGCFNQRSVSALESLRAERGLISIRTSFRDGRTGDLHIMTKPPEENRYSTWPWKSDFEDLYESQVKKGPWVTRAWTLQEHVLPGRLLFYTDKMLFWECDHCRLSEDRFPQMQGDSIYPLSLMRGGAQRDCNDTQEVEEDRRMEVVLTGETWYCKLVEDYMSRAMTFSRDKLIAIGALAQATSQRRHIKYLAGLWGDSLRYGLTWRRGGPGYKLTTSKCPSWSWASQSSAVSYELLAHAWPQCGPADPRVLDAHVEPLDMRNPFGDVKSGHVILQTKVQTGRVLPDFLGLKTSTTWCTDIDARALFIDTGTMMSLWPAPAYMDDDTAKCDQVLIAVIGYWGHTTIALLLHPPCHGAEAYRRVGLAHLGFESVLEHSEVRETFSDEFFKEEMIKWQTQTIKIV